MNKNNYGQLLNTFPGLCTSMVWVLKNIEQIFKRFSLGVYTVLLQFDISVNTILHNFGIQIH